jgi:hypothetical protein
MLNHLKPINTFFVLGQKIYKKHSEKAVTVLDVRKQSTIIQDCEN